MKIRRHIIITISIIATCFAISSCSVGKKYTRPDLNLPATFRDSTIILTADSLTLPWQTFFKDTILIGHIQTALERNKDVIIALKTVEQMELHYKQAKLNLLPILDLDVGATRTWLSKNSLNGSLSEQFIGTPYMDDYTATLRLSWEADIWGKAKMHKEGALANYFRQKENLSALKTRIIVQVAKAYYNLLALDEQLSVAQQNVTLADRTLEMIRVQYNSSLVTSVGLEQAVAQKKTAELLVPLAKQQIEIQENALSILCGYYPEKIERAGHLEDAMPDVLLATGVPAELISRRSDVKASEYSLVSANANTGLAKAAMYPSFSLTPSIGTNSFKFNSWFDLPGSVIKTVGANLTQPIFRKKSLRTAYEIAEIEQGKTAEQFKQVVLNAVGEVSDALATINYAQERLALISDKTNALKKATNDVILLYKNGMAMYLEVITAQNNSLQNDLEAISIQKNKLDAITELYRALGGGTEE